MKRYHVPEGRMADYQHPAPDRTATRAGRSWDSDLECCVWPSRGAMLQACKMSDTGVLGARPFRPIWVTDDRLFNVDMNGARIATGISRDEATVYQIARRAANTGTCYVYLMDRPLTGRRPVLYTHTFPRLPSMKVSAAERQKLHDKLLLDGTMVDDQILGAIIAKQAKPDNQLEAQS